MLSLRKWRERWRNDAKGILEVCVGGNTVSKKEEHRLDRAEDRTGKLENRLLEYNQVETREKY